MKHSWYVYLLQDPRNKQVFFIGKGINNGVLNNFNHYDILKGKKGPFKRIEVIERDGYEVKPNIIKYGLTEEIAYEIESAPIYFGEITRLYIHDESNFSKIDEIIADEIPSMVEYKELKTDKPIILIDGSIET